MAKGNKNKTRKVSKRVLAMHADPTSVWGKNNKLETFWSGLASGKKIVVIYKGGKHQHVELPNLFTKKYTSALANFETDSNVVAILSSNMSQDSYEQFLYPKAKDKSVEYVIKHYTKYFKPLTPLEKFRIPF